MPAAVSAEHVLALLTRVRATRVATGEIGVRRLYDVRAFKTAFAELGYLRRLAAGGRTGGTVVTSMPQLVAGLARLHPTWKMTGDPFVDRDRHHQAVRRRLRDLQAMGLLHWRIGRDADEEDARTELELREAPDILDEELADARDRMRRWRQRYGRSLNTGSTTGVRNAASHGRPLTDRERVRRGRDRTLDRAARRGSAVGGLSSNTAPPCGASASPQNDQVEPSTNLSPWIEACRERTGVTRASAPGDASASAARQPLRTAASTRGVCAPREVGGWDAEALLSRVRAREAQRAPVLDLIAAQVRQRASETACWDAERSCPAGRLREAWVAARWGVRQAAEFGSAHAGRVTAEDLERLDRARKRYERYAAARPTGMPAGGLGALLAIGAAAAAHDHARPQLLAYGIRALDQLSRRMRAVATESDATRRVSQARRAAERHEPIVASSRLCFRTPGVPGRPGANWPAWVLLDDAGAPLLKDGQVQNARPDWFSPDPRDVAEVQRDAQLLAGLWPTGDGRAVMAGRHREQFPAARDGHAVAQRYMPPAHDVDVDPELLELAHRTGLPLGEAERVDGVVRAELLDELRAEDRRQLAVDTERFWQSIHHTLDARRQDER